MKFPKLTQRRNRARSRKELNADLQQTFYNAESYTEFAANVAVKYGINVDSIFSKWKLAYLTIEYGKF